jgi:hypothetical protein
LLLGGSILGAGVAALVIDRVGDRPLMERRLADRFDRRDDADHGRGPREWGPGERRRGVPPWADDDWRPPRERWKECKEDRDRSEGETTTTAPTTTAPSDQGN